MSVHRLIYLSIHCAFIFLTVFLFDSDMQSKCSRARCCPAVLALSISNARPPRHSPALTFLILSCLLFVCSFVCLSVYMSTRLQQIGPPWPLALVFFHSAAPVLGRSGPPPLRSSAAPVLRRSGPRSLRSSAVPVLGRCDPRWLRSSAAAVLKRPVQDSVAFGARPLGRSATIALDCFCLPLTLLSFARLFARLQQIGPFGSDVLGSGSLGSASSARAASARTASDRHRRIGPPSAWPLRIGLLRLAILGLVPRLGPPRIGALGSNPSSSRRPWSPDGLG